MENPWSLQATVLIAASATLLALPAVLRFEFSYRRLDPASFT